VRIWERVEAALSGLGVDMAANQFMTDSPDDLPDEFIVYQMISDPPEQHADDAETLRVYRVEVSYYSRSGFSGMPDIEAAMLAAGFRRAPAREVPYSPETRHYGLAMDFNYLDEE